MVMGKEIERSNEAGYVSEKVKEASCDPYLGSDYKMDNTVTHDNSFMWLNTFNVASLLTWYEIRKKYKAQCMVNRK